MPAKLFDENAPSTLTNRNGGYSRIVESVSVRATALWKFC